MGLCCSSDYICDINHNTNNRYPYPRNSSCKSYCHRNNNVKVECCYDTPCNRNNNDGIRTYEGNFYSTYPCQNGVMYMNNLNSNPSNPPYNPSYNPSYNSNYKST